MKTKLLKSAIVAALIMLSTRVMAFTAVVSGAWSNPTTWGGVGPGASVSNQDIIIPNGLTVDLDMDVTFSGVLNSFTVDGIMNSVGNNNLTISAGAFGGAGSMHIWRLSFNGLLTTWSQSGSLFVHVFQNQGATLAVTSVVNVSDTLDLDGGSVVLSSGSNLTMGANSNVRVNNGSITTTGGVFNTASYDAWYVGASKTTGLELNTTTLNNLHINLSAVTNAITQGVGVVHVGGNLDMPVGEYSLNGNHLIIQGDVMLGAGSVFVSSATSDLTLGGSGPSADDLAFSAGSSINNLVINRVLNGSVGLSTGINIAGNLDLTSGDLMVNSGGTITMNAASNILVGDGDMVLSGGSFVGTAAYNVFYTMHSRNSDIELTGTGLNNVTVGMIASTETVTLTSDIVVDGNLNLLVGNLALGGSDLTLNATFTQDPAALILGDSLSSLNLNLTSAGTDTIYFGSNNTQRLMNLNLNIPASSILYVATNLIIHNQLNMMSGKIEIGSAGIHIGTSAAITGYSDTKYIITSGTGQLYMWVFTSAPYVVFPVGSAAHFAPAQIQQTAAGSSGVFQVRAMDGVFSQGLTGYNSAISESVVNKTWAIDAAVGVTVNMNLKLGWVVADEVNGFNRNLSYISHYMTNWDMYLSSAAVSGANNTYETTRTGVTSLSPFVVVDTSALLSTENIVRTGISIYPNPTVDFITLETGDVHGIYVYEVYDATGKMVYSISNSNSVNRINMVAFVNGYYIIRITDKETNAVITKRVVKE